MEMLVELPHNNLNGTFSPNTLNCNFNLLGAEKKVNQDSPPNENSW